jgi:hypothetical protein
MKKNYFSLHQLPKLQSTSFWFERILGIKILHSMGKTNNFIEGLPWAVHKHWCKKGHMALLKKIQEFSKNCTFILKNEIIHD